MLGRPTILHGPGRKARTRHALQPRIDAMSRPQLVSSGLIAVVAVAVGFLLAGQVKAQLLTPSNQVARNQALVHSVQDLERTNEADRQKIAALRAQITALEAEAADQSDTT